MNWRSPFDPIWDDPPSLRIDVSPEQAITIVLRSRAVVADVKAHELLRRIIASADDPAAAHAHLVARLIAYGYTPEQRTTVLTAVPTPNP